jgi:ubiquitin-conjugating enzyme E2 O
MDEDGIWQAQLDSNENDEWEDYVMEVESRAQIEDIAPDNEVHTSWWDHIVPTMTAVPADQQDTASVSQVPSSTLRSSSPDVPRDASEKEDALVDEATLNGGEDGDRESHWKRFEVLPEAPQDHAFFNSTPSQPSRNFLTRLQKEYRALSSSLPESILVRAYEDRSDLLRSLIIGSENTPYEDAPFVIDWMLDSDFPQSPPIAHFFSWTNGNGRVNPNLYEEGKVCLSILGTWAGDRNESWSPARSSLLQALVSIQGLVLVKEPWFCEPAYDKLRGTEEGIINSRLYNEKAYVLSRGFVRRALEVPLGSLESEIGWLYRKQGRLAKVLCNARALVEKSRTEPSSASSNANAGGDRDSEPAVPRLTAGGIITLERTLVKLEALQQASPAP